MRRGDRREPIFADDTDRETFLRTFAETVARSGWLVHASVLMGTFSVSGSAVRLAICSPLTRQGRHLLLEVSDKDSSLAR